MLNEGTLNLIQSGNSDWKGSVSEKDTADYTAHDSSVLQANTEQTPKQQRIIQKDQITFTSEYVDQLGFSSPTKRQSNRNVADKNGVKLIEISSQN